MGLRYTNQVLTVTVRKCDFCFQHSVTYPRTVESRNNAGGGGGGAERSGLNSAVPPPLCMIPDTFQQVLESQFPLCEMQRTPIS